MPPPSVRPPHQARSRESQRRIVEAARHLFEEKDFDQVGVQQIAREAGLTVGAFYARFDNKEGLLRHLEDGLEEDWDQQFADLTAHAVDDLEGVVRGLVAKLLVLYRRHLGALRVLVQRAKTDAVLRDRMQGLGRKSVDEAVQWILQHRGSMRHPDPEFAVEFGLLLVRSALREMVLFREVTSTRELDDRLLQDELVRMFLTYIGTDSAGAAQP